jgi:S-DNA-T family DNA segregation ATPase FtsK/SpoIIIE
MSYSTASHYPPAESRLRDLFARYGLRAAGLAMMALTAAFFASLVTWDVNDPSFSYAADAPVANLLGRPGAVFADLAMQSCPSPFAAGACSISICRAARSVRRSPGSAAA